MSSKWIDLPVSRMSVVNDTTNVALLVNSDGSINVNATISGAVTLIYDTNYGSVGANTIRTAAQIGNAAGAAAFGTGVVSAQTLRVVLPTDQSAIPVTQSTSPWVVSGTVLATQSGSWTTGRTWTLSSTTDSVNVDNFPSTFAVTQGTSPWVVSGTIGATQSGTWNINNISGTVSLPSGASTSANQTTEIASLASIDGKLNSLGQKTMANSVPVVIASDQSAVTVTGTVATSPNVNVHDGAGVSITSTGSSLNTNITNTVPVSQSGTWNIATVTALTSITNPVAVTQSTSPWIVSGTVTANAGTNLNTSLLALDTSVNGILVAQASTTSGQTGPLIQGAVTTAAPAYTTAKTSPLSLTTTGALRIDGSGATQPVSGTIAATQSGTWSTRTQDGSGNSVSSTGNALDVNLKTSSITLNVSAAQSGTWNVGTVTTLTSITNPVAVTQSTSPWVVSGTVTANAGTNLNTSLLALDTSVNGILLAQGANTAGQTGPLIQGAVTTAAPSYTTAKSNPLSLTTTGSLRVDGSGSTQPVSGTVTLGAGAAVIGALTANQSINNAQIAGVATAVDNGVSSTGCQRVVIASNNTAFSVNATGPTLTKGMQGSTGFSTQDLKDAGRNVTNYFMAIQIVSTNTDALLSLTGYKSGAAVGATTTPAVVTSGKIYRINSITLSYVTIITTPGAIRFTLRANTGGTVLISSAAVANWTVGEPTGIAPVAGKFNTVTIPFPDGLEFAAGTGIGISQVGLNTVGTAAAVGYGIVTISGYEY